MPAPALASLFQGEQLDQVAEATSWLVLVVAPIVLIGVFWMVHIIPEKIAERRHHPQARAIQALCLLSLVFGGLLWPIALLWAVTKPVLHKAAYGYDYDTPGRVPDAPVPTDAAVSAAPAAETELAAMKARIARLEDDAQPLQDEMQALRTRLAGLDADASRPAQADAVAAGTSGAPTPARS